MIARATLDPVRTPPPSDESAERALLGCILLDPVAIGLAAAIVGRQDFFKVALSEVFGACMTLHGRGAPVDVVTVSSELGDGSVVGGRAGRQLFLAELSEEVPTGANVEFYARRVLALSDKRQLIYDRWRELEAAYLEAPPEATDAVEQLLDVQVAEVSASAIHAAIVAKSECAIEIWPTGIRPFDRHLKGFGPGQVWVVLCETGGGKTTFHQSVGIGVAQRETRVAYIALEMSMDQLQAQVVARLAGVSEELTLTGHSSYWDEGTRSWIYRALNDRERDAVWRGCREYEQLGKFFSFIRPRGVASPETLGTALDHSVSALGAKVIVVDYIQALVGLSDKDQRQTVSEAVQRCVQVAEREGVCVVLAGQRTRAAQETAKWTRPRKTEGAWSSSLENGASVVLSLVPHVEDRHTIVYVQKRRFRIPGVGSDFAMSFDVDTGRYGCPSSEFVEKWKAKEGGSDPAPKKPDWVP